MTNKKILYGVFAILTPVLIILIAFVWLAFRDSSPKEAPTDISSTAGDQDEELGFLYLQNVKTDKLTRTANVKVFDPATQEIIQIAQISVPFNAEFFDYANGKLFYILEGSAFDYSTEILSLYLKTGKKEQSVKVFGDESHPPKRKVESYLIYENSIFFLDCIDKQGVVSGSNDCRLKKTYFEGPNKGKIEILYDVSDTFRETYSNKTIRVYDPYNNILAFQETTLSDIIGVAGVSYFYELEFNTNRIREFDQAHEEQALLRDKFVEYREPEKKRCLTETLKSEVFKKEKNKRLIGCFDLEELKSISKS